MQTEIHHEAGDAFHTPETWRQEWTDYRSRILQAGSHTLYRPSEPHPLLDALMNDALLRMTLMSDGGTTSYTVTTTFMRPRADRSTAKGRLLADAPSVKPQRFPNDDMPRSTLAGEIDTLDRAYRSCRTHAGRLLLILHVQRELRRAGKTNPARIRGTKEWKARIVADPRSSRECERVYGVSRMTIQRIRKAPV